MRPSLGIGRRRRTLGLVVVAALLAATAGAVLFWAPWHHPIPPPLDPELTYTQDATGVHLRIHNRNAHWGLRNQPLVITLHDDRRGFNILRTFGPHMDYKVDPETKKPFRCCEITQLPPNGDYTFDLPLPPKPSPQGIAMGLTNVVDGIRLTLRGGDGWVRM